MNALDPLSPEALWMAVEHLEAAGRRGEMADVLRLGHRQGWPGFLYGLVRRTPEQAREAELEELVRDALPLSQLAVALARALREEADAAEVIARRALRGAEPVVDPELLEELRVALRREGRDLGELGAALPELPMPRVPVMEAGLQLVASRGVGGC